MFEHKCDRCNLPFESDDEFDDTCPDCIEELAIENQIIGEEKEMKELEHDI